MKNIILIFMILFYFNTSVLANEQKYNPNRPEWKDFCPFGMENADSYNTQKSVIGTDKHWQIKEYNYWVDRKNDFNNDLNLCDAITNNIENQNQCYNKMVDRQNRINQTAITPWQDWQNKKAQWQQASSILQQQNFQQQQLNLQRKQLMIQQSQNMPKWSDSHKQYDVNLNHNIRYVGY